MGCDGGAEGIRTPDFLRAKEALSRTELQPHAKEKFRSERRLRGRRVTYETRYLRYKKTP